MGFGSNTFAYDGLGKRVSKNNITYTYDGSGNLIKSSDGFEFYYDSEGVTGFRYNNVKYVYQKDIQGNVIAILDNIGAVIVKYAYDAWGNHVIINEIINNIIKI